MMEENCSGCGLGRTMAAWSKDDDK
nr:hypothetical protein [Tanacetum cinerariifolium]